MVRKATEAGEPFHGTYPPPKTHAFTPIYNKAVPPARPAEKNPVRNFSDNDLPEGTAGLPAPGGETAPPPECLIIS